jgi:glycosyltransferase involved in cell wall biosynthesis
MKTIVYVISQVSHSKLFEWTAHSLNPDKYKLVFILMHSEETGFELNLKKSGFEVFSLNYQSKKDIPSCVLQMRKLFTTLKPEIVHTHLFEAGIAGMTAARICRIPVRIHTRHDAMIHHDFHPSAVKYDKLINRLATHIIAISANVKEILENLENVPSKKITVIPHGFELQQYANCDNSRVEALKKKYNLSDTNYPIVGCVSRFIKWKGIQYTITAFQNLIQKYPNAVLVLANAQGPYEKELMEQLQKLPESAYRRIIFEPDVTALYHTMDIFIHVPIDSRSEAYGQVYIEALAAGVPSIFTTSGIVSECMNDRKHALLVPFCDAKAIETATEHLLNDIQLRNSIISEGEAMVFRNFTIDKMIAKLEKLYDA